MQPLQPLESKKEHSDLMAGSKTLTGSQALMSWVEDAVALGDWPNKESNFQGFPARLLMILEVYCSAKGAIGSEEMEDWIDPDPVLRKMFPEARPKPPVLMAFRKCHLKEIQECLRLVFDIALRARFGDDDQHQTPIDYCVVRSLDSWFNPRCGANARREASERLAIVGWTDNMSRD